jgi:tetratricopeptide (TPR) repeat protein
VSKSSGPGIVSAAEFDQQVPALAKKEYEQAMKLLRRGQLQGAITRLRQAIALYPEYLVARNDLGVQYLKLKRLDEAAAQFETVVERNPRYFNSRFNLGLVLVERKNYAEAISQFHQAIALDSARPEAHFWLGLALFQTYNLSGAERELTKALLTGGSAYASAHFYLAQVHLKKGARAEAVAALKAYLEEAPGGEFAEEARRSLRKLAAD